MVNHIEIKKQKMRWKKKYPAPNETLWWVPLPAFSARANPHNTGVNSTRDTVLHLDVKFGQDIP